MAALPKEIIDALNTLYTSGGSSPHVGLGDYLEEALVTTGGVPIGPALAVLAAQRFKDRRHHLP